MTQPQTQHKTYFDPHGYFFVSLPGSVYRRKLANRPNQLVDEQGNELIPLRGPSSNGELLSGVLTCRLICITPVHIGSGSYRHDPNVPGNVVADIVRDPNGNPFIPGSSLKGSFRAIAEAVSKSCLSLKQERYDEDKTKLPGVGFRQPPRFSPPLSSYWKQNVEQALRQDYWGRVEVNTSSHFIRCQPEHGLCSCCAIFGTLGYRGRVAFNDACIVGRITPLSAFTPPTWVTIPARNTPQPHRLADKATWASGGLDVHLSQRQTRQGAITDATLVVPHPLGRKFYPNWDPHGHFQTKRYDWSRLSQGFPQGQQLNGTFYQQVQEQYGRGGQAPSLYKPAEFQHGEPHNVIPIGTVLEFRLYFQSLLLWELGLVLLGMGIGAAWLPKVGEAKAYGLGSVRVQQQALHLVADVAIYTDPPQLSAQQVAQQINDCLAAFRKHRSYHADGVADVRAGFSLNLAAQRQNGQLRIASNATPMPP